MVVCFWFVCILIIYSYTNTHAVTFFGAAVFPDSLRIFSPCLFVRQYLIDRIYFCSNKFSLTEFGSAVGKKRRAAQPIDCCSMTLNASVGVASAALLGGNNHKREVNVAKIMREHGMMKCPNWKTNIYKNVLKRK